MLNIGAWLSWQAIKGLVPWASPWLAYALAIAATAGLLVLYGYHLGGEGKRAAVAQNDLEWMAKINDANNQLAELRQKARDAGDAEQPSPADRAKRLQLCRQSATCRERGQ
jgi:hypothetical protein